MGETADLDAFSPCLLSQTFIMLPWISGDMGSRPITAPVSHITRKTL